MSMKESAAPAATPPRRSRLRRWAVVGLVLVAALAAGWWWQQRPVPVATVTARVQPLVRTLQFTGRVETPARVDLGSTITGRVAFVRVDEGDAVRPGAALVELEADEVRAALLQARANAQQARASLRVAEREVRRVRELVASRFFSESRLDEALRTVDVARAQQLAADAAVASAQARLDQTTIRAPSAGRILLRQVEAGQIVQAGKALLTLGVEGPLEILASVDERFLGELQPGQTAWVRADARPGERLAARLRKLAPAVDADKGAIEVAFRLEGEVPVTLREDMTVSIEVRTAERAQALTLPLQAVRPAGDAAADAGVVLQIDGGRVVERAVTLGLRSLEHVEVRSGLADGAVVLLDPQVPVGSRVQARVGATAPTGLTRDNAGGAMTNGFGR